MIQAHARKKQATPPDPMTNLRYRFGRHALDLAKRELLQDAVPVVLPARVFECLAYLIEHRERAVDRDELARAVFSRSDVSDAQLAQIILRSRRAIGDDGHEQRAIRTVPRFGFRWIAETEVEQVEPASRSRRRGTPPRHRVGDVEAMPQPPRERRHRAGAAARCRSASSRGASSLRPWSSSRPSSSRPALFWNRRATERPSTSSAVAATPRAIMVLPMRVEGPGDVAWARLGLMDYLVDRIRRGGLSALSSETTLNLLRDAGKAATVPDVQQLRKAARADWIVESLARSDAGRWTVRLRATDRHGLVQRGQAQGADLLDTTRIAGDRLLAALGAEVPANGGEPEPGLAERLQRAQSAMLANELDTARRILNEAPELQRSRPQLRYRLAQVDFRAGEYQRGLATLDELLAGEAAHADPMFNARLLDLARRDADPARPLCRGRTQLRRRDRAARTRPARRSNSAMRSTGAG